MVRYREWKVIEEEKAAIKAEKIKRREEKIARGEALGPDDELDPEPSTVLALLKFFAGTVFVILALGWFITGSPLWEWDVQEEWALMIQKHFPVSAQLDMNLSGLSFSNAGDSVYSRDNYSSMNSSSRDMTAQIQKSPFT